MRQRARDTERERETERGEREGGREREGVRGRGRICTHVRETALDLWLLFLCFFLHPLQWKHRVLITGPLGKSQILQILSGEIAKDLNAKPKS